MLYKDARLNNKTISLKDQQKLAKSIFISGAAQGIGAAIAKQFYQQGWKVGIYDLNESVAQQLASQLGSHAKAGQLDVTNYAQWQEKLREFSDWANGINMLINNAGILYSGDFDQTKIEQHHLTIDVNVKGVLNGCHAALPFLQKQKNSKVINLSSASAIYGQPDLISYSASKFAVRGITEGLDIEWRKYNIRVLDLMPLFVNTNMVTDMDAGTIKNMGVHFTPEDIAKAAYQVATSKNPLQNTHHPIGWSAKIMYKLSGLSPQIMNRFTNTWLSRK